MPVLFFAGWYTPELCSLNRDVIFVFGDNARRVGMGGQAVIRKEPNVYGIATKRIGDMHRDSFFREGNEADRKVVEQDLAGLRKLLEEGRTVIIPVKRGTDPLQITLGLERARLTEVAPSLYQLICDRIDDYAREFGSNIFQPKKAS